MDKRDCGKDKNISAEIKATPSTSAKKHLLVLSFPIMALMLLMTFSFRALEMHGRVAHLTMSLARIDWERIWPGPYLVSRHIRRIVRAFKCCCRGIKALFTSLLVRRHDHAVQGGRVEEDIETGTQIRETVELSQQDADQRASVGRVEGDYRESLRGTFGEAELVDEIMSDIEIWKSNLYGFMIHILADELLTD